MRLISWNLNNRVRRTDKQAEALLARQPDLIALQEVTQKTSAALGSAFQQAGFSFVADSFQHVEDRSVLRGPRRYGLLIASRWPFQVIPAFPIPWSERVLSALIDCPSGQVELHAAYIPAGSSHHWIKIETLEGIYQRLARKCDIPRLLCGDFNTPKEETPSGEVVTWRRHLPRWQAGEHNILVGLAKFDLYDAYRFQHGYQVHDYSWFTRTHVGRRYDHIFASRSLLSGVNCSYLHDLRENRLSDHSAIMAEFA